MTFRLKSVTTSRMIHLATKQHLVLRWIYQSLSIDRVRVQELRSDREVAGKGQARQRKTAGRMDQLPGMLQSGNVAALRKVLQQVFISRGRTENQEFGFSIKTQIINLLSVISVSKLTARSISVCYARDDNIANWMFSFSYFNSKRLKSAAYGAKVLELTGLILSLIALSVSVVVFSYFRSVKRKA